MGFVHPFFELGLSRLAACLAAISLFLLADLRNDPVLFHFLPQMGELGRRYADRLSSFFSH
jgi:hypothetical protein